MQSTNNIRVRFAPSPTGHLHVGGLRTALFNWLFARHNNGVFLLRIEDTDTDRSKQEYTDAIMQALDWAALQADEQPVVQSARIDQHKKVLQQLLDTKQAYRCYCTEQELVARYEKAAGEENFFVKYDGFCRTRTDVPDKPFVIRFALPDNLDAVSFNDLVRGSVTIGMDQLDDFIIARSDGRPMYNFVVVVDDAFMNISHVIRGEDHISNTPKQILLYQACGYTVPKFAHIPMILGPSGDRLSKRDGAVSVLAYRTAGYLPDAFLNYLARLGWSHGDQELFTRQELIDYFSLDAVGKKGSIFDVAKLDWVNGMYLREKKPNELHAIIRADVVPTIDTQLSSWDAAQIQQAIALYQERVATLVQLADNLRIVHDGPNSWDQQAVAKWVGPDTAAHLHTLCQMLELADDFTVDIVSETVKKLAANLGVKLVTLAQPIRIALIGSAAGPGVFALVALVGKTETLRRIRALANGIQ